ncbi:MAG: DUF1501 domain-containing protein [bacterium]|jgi:uncharacterized protein (DUF1501 family)|nr:DUF1501 domain-containing protein [bacterium]
MASTTKDPILVVLQLSGGNDYLNTVIPYANSLYWDNRPLVNIPEDQVIPLDDAVGFHPSMAALKPFYDEGQMAVIHGVGYPNSPRSHFRSMDIWHTCEPDTVGTEGWLGRVIRDIDPNKENVVTGVSFGQSMFRSMVLQGVPVACVSGSLETYGMLPGIEAQRREKILQRFSRAYAPAIGLGEVMDYLGQTGIDSMAGADILKVAPGQYSSTVTYPDSKPAQTLRSIAQIHLANLGTRIFYCDHGPFDTHASQLGAHATLWTEVSEAVSAFFADLRQQQAADNVVMLLFTEFGRRVHDNGSGTDHGAGGVAFVIGDAVQGGQYGEYPSLRAEDLSQGDLVPKQDFRGVYSTILEDWLQLDAHAIVGGAFEKPAFINN